MVRALVIVSITRDPLMQRVVSVQYLDPEGATMARIINL